MKQGGPCERCSDDNHHDDGGCARSIANDDPAIRDDGGRAVAPGVRCQRLHEHSQQENQLYDDERVYTRTVAPVVYKFAVEAVCFEGEG